MVLGSKHPGSIPLANAVAMASKQRALQADFQSMSVPQAWHQTGHWLVEPVTMTVEPLPHA